MMQYGFSQAEFARRIGVADTQVSRWRRGQVIPSLRYLQQIADTFGIPRSDLDELAGYPTTAAFAATASDQTDAAVQAQLSIYQARYRHILEKIPPAMWQAYIESCEALAEALNASFQEALSKTQEAAAGNAAPVANRSAVKAARTIGFHHRERPPEADET